MLPEGKEAGRKRVGVSACRWVGFRVSFIAALGVPEGAITMPRGVDPAQQFFLKRRAREKEIAAD
jgi:hypothetical protein